MSEKIPITEPTDDDLNKIRKALEEKLKVQKLINNILSVKSIEHATKIKARLESICSILQQRLDEQSSNAASGSS